MGTRAPSTRWSRWRADRRGVAAIEFALVIPFLLVLYFGGYQVTQAVGAYRKLTDASVELANVTAQYTTMSCTDFSNVMNASSQIMSPYPTTNMNIVISQIATNSSNVAKVQWSQASSGATALVVNSTVTLPAGLSTANSYYILTQTTYTWVPAITSSFVRNIPMSNQLYIIPRNSASIISTC
jgi:Flp pilus assembly protein TadG